MAATEEKLAIPDFDPHSSPVGNGPSWQRRHPGTAANPPTSGSSVQTLTCQAFQTPWAES